MDILSNFSENISEIIFEKGITVEQFAKQVDIAYSEVYRYLRKQYLPKLSNIIKIADCYGYSIDYLLGFIPFPENVTFNSTPPFNEQFKRLLKERHVSRYKINKDTKIPSNRLDDWYKGKFTPSLEKALELCKYFNCSLDYLLGREK